MTPPNTNISKLEIKCASACKGLKPGEYRIKMHGKGTGVQINKKINQEQLRRIINVLLTQDEQR